MLGDRCLQLILSKIGQLCAELSAIQQGLGNFSLPAHAEITQPRFGMLNRCPILLKMSCKDQRDGHQTSSTLLNLTRTSNVFLLTLKSSYITIYF